MNTLKRFAVIVLAISFVALGSACKKGDASQSNTSTSVTPDTPESVVMELDTKDYDSQPKEDAVQIYNDALEKTNALTSFCADMDIIKEFGNHEQVSSADSSTSVSISSGEALYISNGYSNTLALKDSSFVEESRSLYYGDGMMYITDFEGKKQYYPLGAENEEELAESYSSVALDFPADAFKESVVTRNENTVEVVTKTDIATAGDLVTSFMTEDMFIYYVPVSSSFDYQYSDILLSFGVNENGCFDYMKIEYVVSFAHYSGTESVKYTVNVAFTDTDNTVEITAPDGLDSYTPYLEEEELTQEELDGQLTNDVLALYDSSNQRITNFNSEYMKCCMKYGRASVDNIVETFESLSSTGVAQ